MYWKEDTPTETPSIRVEIASYALMAFVKMGRIIDAVQVMRWLITERKATGGFHSTTDTVIGELKHTIKVLSDVVTLFYRNTSFSNDCH